MVDTSEDRGPVLEQTELARALARAADTGHRVEVASETTATSITWAMPDGTAAVEVTAGPARVAQADGSWAPIDTTLHVSADGTVGPAMVPGETVFSGGGDDLLAALGDDQGNHVTMSWTGPLPQPELDGDTATYRDVLPDVDLVLTATRLGFSQLLVVNSRPDTATLDRLRSIDIPVQTTGADIGEGVGGELQITDSDTAQLVGTAAAPLMWDARTDAHSDQPAAVRQVGLEVDDQATDPAAEGDATLTLTPDAGFLTDPATVYPVTIDPTQTLGALGDAFIQTGISSNQGGSTELRTGTYDGGATVARSLLRFDVGALKNRVVQSATLGMWENHSYSCSPRWVDIREAADFNPGTVTWGNQPWIGGIVANAAVARGYSSACPAGWVDFNMTSWAQNFADTRNNRPNLMALALTVGDERDSYSWKKFNSDNAAGNVPTLYFTFDGVCDQWAGHRVCGLIRDKWASLGGPGSYLGLPLTSETGINGGAYNHFQGGSIYWSPATGAHVIRGAIRDRWGQLGWENSTLGYPTTDETGVNGGGYNHFTGGSIYWSPATGAWEISGKFRDKWAATGWENGPLGFPASPPYGMAQPNSFHQYFSRDTLMYLSGGAPAAYYVQGVIRAKYAAMGYEGSYLGFPTSDQTTVTGGLRNHFQGGSIYWSLATGAHTIRGPIRDKWLNFSASSGYLGFPTTDHTTITGGTYNDFTGGSIYWSQPTGAHTILGPIRDKWTALGRQNSTLGFPTTDTAPSLDGEYNTFQDGEIWYTATRGAHTISGDFLDFWHNLGGEQGFLGSPSQDISITDYGQRQDFNGGQLVLTAADNRIQECTITGTSGPDRIVGTSNDDIICSFGGEDDVDGGDGSDTLYLGDGDDTAAGGPEFDAIFGEGGNDKLSGGSGDDAIYGDGGNNPVAAEGVDQISGDDGNDYIRGEGGDDSIDGGEGNDNIDGGSGADNITPGPGEDFASGDAGNDIITGGAQNDSISGGDGDDTLFGDSGDDALVGGRGSDAISGGMGADFLNGDSGADFLEGQEGDDRITATLENDTVDGGGQDDTCTLADAGSATGCIDVVRATRADVAASLVSAVSPDSSLVTPAPASTSATGTFTATTDGLTVQTAPTAGQPIVIGGTDPSMIDGSTAATPSFSLTVPAAGQSGGQLAHDGSVVYAAGSTGVGMIVQALPNASVRIATTLESVASPRRIDYALNLPAGAMLRLESDGSVSMVSSDGSIIISTVAPWAADANGTAVPTHYEVNGNNITQVVEPSTADITYPVVADPTWASCHSNWNKNQGQLVVTFPRAGGTANTFKGQYTSTAKLPGGSSGLYCGNADAGYRHIQNRHQTTSRNGDGWDQYAVGPQCCAWQYAADYGMRAALQTPQGIGFNVNKQKACYQRYIYFWVKTKTGRWVQTRNYYVAVAIVATNNSFRVLTGYPGMVDACGPNAQR